MDVGHVGGDEPEGHQGHQQDGDDQGQHDPLRSRPTGHRGRPPGPQTSLVKLVASNLKQEIGKLAMRLWGPAGLQLPGERPLYGNGAP